MRARKRRALCAIVSALTLCLPGAAAAQVNAVAQQDLSFGLLTPGVATQVLVNDVARRGAWIVTGRGQVTVSMVLPTSMQNGAGSTIPLVFGPTDAGWKRTGTGAQPTLVDPQTPFSMNVPNRQSVEIYLGGTAQPSMDQAAGAYSATITLIVAQP